MLVYLSFASIYANIHNMKRFFVGHDLEVNKTYKIDGIEHNHIKNVMRMGVGDELILVCGDEFDYHGKIVAMSKGDTSVTIQNCTPNIYNPKCNITVFQALVKSDNMTLIIQKLTELGVNSFVPFESEFITSKDKFGKTSKFQEISNQSIKQCKRSRPMRVAETISFDTLVKSLKDYDIVLFANECERVEKLESVGLDENKKVAIIVGSEGGFSESEINKLIQNGAKSISLGKRILRAETASIALTSVVMYLMGEWQYE